MKKKYLIIFAVDGTLIQSVGLHQSALLQSLQDLGFKDSGPDWNSYKHHTDSYIFKAIFEKKTQRKMREADLAEFEELLCRNISKILGNSQIPEVKGARGFLAKLNSNPRLDVIFATAGLLKPTILTLRKAGIPCREDSVIASNHLFSRCELVRAAMVQAKNMYSIARYARTVSFGSALPDYETAKNLNMEFVGINSVQLGQTGLDHLYEDFTDEKLNRHIHFSLTGLKPPGAKRSGFADEW